MKIIFRRETKSYTVQYANQNFERFETRTNQEKVYDDIAQLKKCGYYIIAVIKE